MIQIFKYLKKKISQIFNVIKQKFLSRLIYFLKHFFCIFFIGGSLIFFYIIVFKALPLSFNLYLYFFQLAVFYFTCLKMCENFYQVLQKVVYLLGMFYFFMLIGCITKFTTFIHLGGSLLLELINSFLLLFIGFAVGYLLYPYLYIYSILKDFNFTYILKDYHFTRIKNFDSVLLFFKEKKDLQDKVILYKEQLGFNQQEILKLRGNIDRLEDSVRYLENRVGNTERLEKNIKALENRVMFLNTQIDDLNCKIFILNRFKLQVLKNLNDVMLTLKLKLLNLYKVHQELVSFVIQVLKKLETSRELTLDVFLKITQLPNELSKDQIIEFGLYLFLKFKFYGDHLIPLLLKFIRQYFMEFCGISDEIIMGVIRESGFSFPKCLNKLYELKIDRESRVFPVSPFLNQSFVHSSYISHLGENSDSDQDLPFYIPGLLSFPGSQSQLEAQVLEHSHNLSPRQLVEGSESVIKQLPSSESESK